LILIPGLNHLKNFIFIGKIILFPNLKKKKDDDKSLICARKVNLLLTPLQKRIILSWMDAHIRMYNATIKLMRSRYYNGERTIVSFKTLRTQFLKEIRNEIQKKSQLKDIVTDTKVKTHMLDCAIQSACASYKSAFSNFRNGNIKHFRIRYIKLSKKSKIIDIPPYYFSKKYSTICEKILGKEIETSTADFDDSTKMFNLSDIINKYKVTCKIHYNEDTNRYTLLVPEYIEKQKKQENDNKKEYIGLDPGLRTFLTGVDKTDVYKIAPNIGNKIKEYFMKTKTMDGINKYTTKDICKEIKKNQNKKVEEFEEKIKKMEEKSIPSKIRKKYQKRWSRKLSNQIDDMHWKTIKYLTDNYKSISIGKLSTKSIVKKGKSCLDQMNKTVAMRMKFYQFMKRLEYKCKVKNIIYNEVDEHYTSKMCTNCGTIKENLGANKIYNCGYCNIKIDRDVNGARNIFMKSLE